MREADINKLNEEYQRMVQGLKDARLRAETDMVLANPVLPKDILKGEFYLSKQAVESIAA